MRHLLELLCETRTDAVIAQQYEHIVIAPAALTATVNGYKVVMDRGTLVRLLRDNSYDYELALAALNAR